MNPNMTGEAAEKIMKRKGIKIEQRVAHYTEEEDLWRRGTYIYKNKIK
jgi:hypothetical protein